MTGTALLTVDKFTRLGLRAIAVLAIAAALILCGSYAYDAATTKVQMEIKTAVNQTFVEGTADAGEAMQARNLFSFNPPRH